MATEFNTQVGNEEYRLQFETNNKAHYLLMQSAARRCIDRAHMTNADRIRSMTDEKLADLINREISYCAPTSGDCEKTSNDCKACWLEWLQQPAEETER